MRICIVSLGIVPFFNPRSNALYGGAEVQSAFVANALAARGEDVCFVVANMSAEDRLPHAAYNAFNSGEGAPVIRFFHPRLDGIVGALKRADADLYYQHCAGMITGVTSLFCRQHDKRFVYGAGSNTDFAFSTVRIDSLRDRLLYYSGLRLASGIVVQNRHQEEICRKHFQKPIRVISGGVSSNHSGESERDLIVWVGTIRRIKQPELMIELAKRFPDKSFVMIGGASGTEKSFARDVTEAAEAVDNLRMTGLLPTADVQSYLGRAKLLVNTSKVEGFPNAYMEAWSHGVPVLTFNDVDGLVAEEEVGVVCKTIEELANAVDDLSQNEKRREAMGERARRLVDERYSPDVIARQYSDFFGQLASVREEIR